MLTMPLNANIPSWAKDLGDVLEIDFPSWSEQGGHYEIRMDKRTRELRCNCEAGKHGVPCHHLGYLTGMVKKPPHPHRIGIQQTSLEAYKQVKKTLSVRQEKVYNYLDVHGPSTNKEVAEGLGWKINWETPRMLELRAKEKVRFAGYKQTVAGRHEMLWEVV